jgi:4-hydroxybenzoate polyprenyltransferase
MLALQASIGALNDLVDAGADTSRKPGKPIPRGAVRFGEAAALVVIAAATGLLLSAISGPATLAAAVGGLACGYLYDLRLSRTPWSWLPLAIGLPILPIHAWLGARGEVPPGLLWLVPLGILAGAALSLGNGLVDAERDAASGRRSAVVLAGRERAWLAHAAGLVIVLGLAWWLGPRPAGLAAPWTAALAAGSGLVVAGMALARAVRPALRERGWELEAIGVAIVGAAWIAGLAGA